jgi:type I restriction enzyme, R subunit
MMATKEAKARIKINKLLEEAGWRFLDEDKKSANVVVELNVKINKHELNEYGEDFEKTTNGFVDFLLLDENGKPYIVLEAKSEDKDPLIGKEQAREYAKSLYVKYVILSNGNIHYFWNTEKGNPQLITGFPSYESLRASKAFYADPLKLFNEDVKADYIAVSQMQRYADDPRYQNEYSRSDFLKDSNLRFLRKYQINAVKALQS